MSSAEIPDNMLTTTSFTLINGKVICDNCPYQQLSIATRGIYADFSREECAQVLKNVYELAARGVSDVKCGLGAIGVIASQREGLL